MWQARTLLCRSLDATNLTSDQFENNYFYACYLINYFTFVQYNIYLYDIISVRHYRQITYY